MEGILTLHNLRCMCVLGVYPHERQQAQAIEVTVSFQLCTPQKDRLDQTLDYDHVASLCQEVMVEGKFQLIESLAQALHQALTEHFDLKGIKVKIYKPGVPKHARGVSFEVGS